MAWTEKGDYRAVLSVDGEAGLAILVLDSRLVEVRGGDELTTPGSRWDRRQAARLPYRVTAARDDHATTVGRA